MELNLERIAEQSVTEAVRECKDNMHNPAQEDVMEVAQNNVWHNVIRLSKRNTHDTFISMDVREATRHLPKFIGRHVNSEGRIF